MSLFEMEKWAIWCKNNGNTKYYCWFKEYKMRREIIEECLHDGITDGRFVTKLVKKNIKLLQKIGRVMEKYGWI